VEYSRLSKFYQNQILLHVTKRGTAIFARGGMILEQIILKHVWGLYTYSKARVFKRTANLKLVQLEKKPMGCHTTNGQLTLRKSFKLAVAVEEILVPTYFTLH
jgi:hypothetical protein